jgi:UDP-N-acetylglucosamine--N-acetylmuramyl-(pentapeptide) pyrophosphoryl-undecaprenol N-acetylglucosamine transferase
MRILIAAGGTGGHIYPALAVARSLRERSTDPEFRWVGGRRGLEAKLVPAAGFTLDRLWLRSLRTVSLSVHLVADLTRLVASAPQALALMTRWRPNVVFTTGGYVAIPVLAAAAVLRVPAVMWEGNLVAGRSVRATARLASAIATSFEDTARSLPGRTYVTGTPIRSFAGVDQAAARATLGLPPDVPNMLVFGGSQAVRRLNDAVSEALPELVEKISVVHMTGDSGYASALARKQTLAAGQRERYKPFRYLGDEMMQALVAADLLVGRAGSSTLAEACALGLPMIVVPYPYAGAHQQRNAERLAEAGAARIVPDRDFDAAALLDAAGIVNDEPSFAAMRAAARRFGRPHAADAVAELVMALGEHRTLPTQAEIDRLARGSLAP